MIRWIPYTFVRTVVFLIAGILLAIYLPSFLPLSIVVATLVIIAVLFLILFLVRQHVPVFVFGLSGLSVILLCGYLHLLNFNQSLDSEHFLKSTQRVRQYRIVITSYAEEKDRSWKVSGNVSDIFTDKWNTASGQVLLYFKKSDFDRPYNYGDVLLVQGTPQEVTAPANPGEFDYKRFLTFRNIYHQHFISEGKVVFIRHEPPNLVKEYAIRARLWANAILHRYVDGTQERAIASALVLGVTDGLDNELLTAYAATGAMHVLAVSGLHISIIYIIILWIFRPLKKSTSGKWIIAGVSLCVLWAYAFVTGLSPSVLRAVTMFTFIAISRATSRTTNIYNTLAASGFCLLIYDPYLIMSVGFQLSYLAVIGIVYLHPLLYNLWEARSWIGNQIWTIICVSIAAQLATFALGLLYFHQFPNYFLLSNLLVIPISFGVLILGLVLIAFNFIPVLAIVLGFLLTWSIKLMNFCVIVVEWFPFSLIEGIYITTFQCWLLMFTITAFILLIQHKKFKYTVIAGVLIMMFTFLQWQRYFENYSNDKITVYKISGHTAIDMMAEGKAHFITDKILFDDIEKLRFHIKPNRLLSSVERVDTTAQNIQLISGGKILVWKAKKILCITNDDFFVPEQLSFDLIVVSNNSVRQIDRLKKFVSSTIVFDSSNSFNYVARMLDHAQKLKLNVYSVVHSGAFEYEVSSKH
jgi:competence protein ComEC